MLTDMVRAGRTPVDAANRLKLQFPEELVLRAFREYEDRLGRVRTLKDPPALIDEGIASWYPGPSEDDRFWPALKRFLEAKPWPDRERSIRDVDASSTKTLSLMAPPGAEKIRTRGLVLGYVQSGKTTNFTALISKAADAGYRLFVVLSGTTNALRRQTQERLDNELVALNREHWISLTTVTRDFGDQPATNVNAFLTDYATQKTLCVIKKNSYRLNRLLQWLAGARPEVLAGCPVLVIDDEADQASLNSATHPDERTRINALLLRLLTALPKVAYVGYTATPFANVFVDPDVPEDLYPRDFIIDLPRPRDYFGPERLFGRERLSLDEGDEEVDGLEMIHRVPDDEAASLQPASAAARFTFHPELTPSLRTAIEYFLLATAARYARGQSTEHSTLLIHTTGYALVHRAFVQPIEGFTRTLRSEVSAQAPARRQQLSELWNAECAAVDAEVLGGQATSFNQVWDALPRALERLVVAVENSISDSRLEYGEEPRVYIVVGGNVLSRGLTLDGLVVSYFIRNASAYDTLLQMGRWFGYRRGYEDLPRIWMTDELRSYFYDLATVEQEMRYDIARYERDGLTPLQFAVRIRTHPQLSITSRLKMQRAKPCSMSYSGRHVQTIQFLYQDRTWLRENLAAGRLLVERSIDSGSRPIELKDQRWLLESVSHEEILRFLEAYQPHPSSISLRRDLLRGYIRDQNVNGDLLRWNVCVLGQARAELGIVDLGLGQDVRLINRSKFRRPLLSPDSADIKALLSKADLIADLHLSAAEYEVLIARSHEDLVSERSRLLPGVGLLLLYPISKDSKPEKASKQREALNAADHILGVAWVFPEARQQTPQQYLSVDLSSVAREEPDWEEDE